MKLEEALKTTRFKNERHKAMLNILHTAYWLKITNSALIKGLGLTMEQFNVMRILNGKHPEPMCVRDIASRMIEKSSNVPRIIDRLVKKDIASRTSSEKDKRETLITLTAQGQAQLKIANNIINPLSEKMNGITDEEARQLNMLLEKVKTSVF